MAREIARRPVVYSVVTLLLGVMLGVIGVGRLSAAGPPDGLEVTEQNIDEAGYIRVHEQGVSDVNVTNGSVSADVTFPAVQTVDGTVSAQQLGPWNVGVVGTPTVSVENLPSPPTLVRGTPEFNPFTVLQSNDEVIEIPSDVVLTDILADVSTLNSKCRVMLISSDRQDVYWQGFAETPTFTDSERIEVNFTSGLQGPLHIEIASFGQQCSGTLLWTGYETP